jgi:hypothetical protein
MSASEAPIASLKASIEAGIDGAADYEVGDHLPKLLREPSDGSDGLCYTFAKPPNSITFGVWDREFMGAVVEETSDGFGLLRLKTRVRWRLQSPRTRIIRTSTHASDLTIG